MINAKNARLSSAYSRDISRGDRKRLAAMRRINTPVSTSGAYFQLEVHGQEQGDEIQDPDHHAEGCVDVDNEYEGSGESYKRNNSYKIIPSLNRPCDSFRVHTHDPIELLYKKLIRNQRRTSAPILILYPDNLLILSPIAGPGVSPYIELKKVRKTSSTTRSSGNAI